jgi:hypothetical protein
VCGGLCRARLPQERFPLDFPEIGLFGLADHAVRGCRSVGHDIADLDLGVLGAGHAAREMLAHQPALIVDRIAVRIVRALAEDLDFA